MPTAANSALSLKTPQNISQARSHSPINSNDVHAQSGTITTATATDAQAMRSAGSANTLPGISTEHSTAPVTRLFNIETFLNTVSNETQFSDAMTELYNHLRRSTPKSRETTISTLQDKQAQMGESAFIEKYHFRFPGSDSLMAGGIEFKSVFSSEEWSKVMVEGINSSPDAIEGKNIVDVGCGNFCFGTVAKRAGANSAAGLDINADAILNAKINQILLFGSETDSVQTSDLLSEQIKSGEKVDTIIACIPQIVNFEATAEPLDIDEIAKSSLADRERYSHQTAPVGGDLAKYDVYGLGLVARLLEQAPEALAPEGQILLNVAGRPGQAVIDGLFEQYGLQATAVASKAFAQQYTGDDTVDLSSWVALEKENNISFEFYKDAACTTEKVSAEQAQAALKQGKPIYHTLTCYRLTQAS